MGRRMAAHPISIGSPFSGENTRAGCRREPLGASTHYHFARPGAVLPAVLRPLPALLTALCLACGSTAPVRDRAPGSTTERDAQPLIDFALPRLDGPVGETEVSLAAQRAGGHAVVVTYVASWCQPCVQTLTNLDRLARGVPSLKLIVVSMDDEPEAKMPALLEYLAFDPRVHPVAVADAGHRAGITPFGEVAAVPVTHLVDSEGRHVESFFGIPPIVYLHRRVLELAESGETSR